MNALRKPKNDPISEAAKLALDLAKGDVQKATKAFELTIRSNRGLRDQLLEPLIASACYDAIRKVSITDRRSTWRAPVERLVPGKVTGSARVVQLAAGNLLMFPLPGGKKLGEATRKDISAASEFYSKQAGDMGHKARWLQLIAQSVPSGKTVNDVLTDKRLRELQREAKSEK